MTHGTSARAVGPESAKSGPMYRVGVDGQQPHAFSPAMRPRGRMAIEDGCLLRTPGTPAKRRLVASSPPAAGGFAHDEPDNAPGDTVTTVAIENRMA